MPPVLKISKDDIINTAVEIVRQRGATALNARSVAAQLNCSTQPVFSNFSTMEELRLAVVRHADALCNALIKSEMEREKYSPYKASGMAYIRFAKEEKELFKLLYMRDRSDEGNQPDQGMFGEMEKLVHSNTGLSGPEVTMFHLEMWAYVHGIAAMFATGFLDLDWDLVSKMLTDAYQGLRKNYTTE